MRRMILFLLPLSLLTACPSSQQVTSRRNTAIRGPEIIVIKSTESPQYQQVITAFSISSRAPVTAYNLQNKRSRLKKLIRRLKRGSPALLFTLGPFATKHIHQAFPKTPLLFALVPRHRRFFKKRSNNVMGISLTRSIRYQFLTIKKLAPRTRTIGVIYNPRYSRKLVRRAKRIIKPLKMRLVAAKVDSAEDVADAIRLFEGQIDALWQIPDPSIQTSFKPLLRFTFRSKTPFFALSEKFVQAGSLVSVSIDYPSIGHQAAALSNKLLFRGATPRSLGIQTPKRLRIALNLTTSRRLGVDCKIAQQVLEYAAKNKFPLRIYP